MVRVGCGVEIGCVATVAGIRRAIVIAVVASRAIVGNGRVRPVQGVIIAVNRECRGFPAGRCRVAHRTVGGDVQRRVVGVDTLVIIRRVAGRTLGRCADVAARVAIEALGCKVCARKRETG